MKVFVRKNYSIVSTIFFLWIALPRLCVEDSCTAVFHTYTYNCALESIMIMGRSLAAGYFQI